MSRTDDASLAARYRRWRGMFFIACAVMTASLAGLAVMIYRIVTTKWRMTDFDRGLFVLCAAGVCAGIVAILVARNKHHTARAAALGRCPRCDYDLRGSSGRCPECGGNGMPVD